MAAEAKTDQVQYFQAYSVKNRHPFYDAKFSPVCPDVDAWIKKTNMWTHSEERPGRMAVLAGIAKCGKSCALNTLLPSRIAEYHKQQKDEKDYSLVVANGLALETSSTDGFARSLYQQMCSQLSIPRDGTVNTLTTFRLFLTDLTSKNPSRQYYLLLDEVDATFKSFDKAHATDVLRWYKQLLTVPRLHVAVTSTSLLLALYFLSAGRSRSKSSHGVGNDLTTDILLSFQWRQIVLHCRAASTSSASLTSLGGMHCTRLSACTGALVPLIPRWVFRFPS